MVAAAAQAELVRVMLQAKELGVDVELVLQQYEGLRSVFEKAFAEFDYNSFHLKAEEYDLLECIDVMFDNLSAVELASFEATLGQVVAASSSGEPLQAVLIGHGALRELVETALTENHARAVVVLEVAFAEAQRDARVRLRDSPQELEAALGDSSWTQDQNRCYWPAHSC